MIDPKVLLSKLADARVEFVMIGGFAVIAHGGTLRTQDLDICCPFTEENIVRLLSAVQNLHPVHRMTTDRRPVGLSPEPYVGWRDLHLGTDAGQLDCLSEVAGVGDYDAVVRQSVEIELPAGACRVLGLDALIRAKEAMSGEKDRRAAAQLKAIRERLAGDATGDRSS